MIRERRKFERIYDLTERVLPEHIDTSVPTPEELGRFLVKRTLKAHGLADEKTIRDHIRGADRPTIQTALQAMVEEGEVVPVRVEGCGDGIQYAHAGILSSARKYRAKQPQVFVLSPFDNLVIHRDRMRQLFDFDYVLECYVPALKRKYGYFVLPILYGEQFAGRMDARADRPNQVFEILTLSLEDGFRADDAFVSALAEQLRDYAGSTDARKYRSSEPRRPACGTRSRSISRKASLRPRSGPQIQSVYLQAPSIAPIMMKPMIL